MSSWQCTPGQSRAGCHAVARNERNCEVAESGQAMVGRKLQGMHVPCSCEFCHQRRLSRAFPAIGVDLANNNALICALKVPCQTTAESVPELHFQLSALRSAKHCNTTDCCRLPSLRARHRSGAARRRLAARLLRRWLLHCHLHKQEAKRGDHHPVALQPRLLLGRGLLPSPAAWRLAGSAACARALARELLLLRQRLQAAAGLRVALLVWLFCK